MAAQDPPTEHPATPPAAAGRPDFGILTLATPSDAVKAIGLALSLRVSNPGVPTAVACSAAVGERLRPYFDQVILEKPGLRGFIHKVHLDDYSPFQTTFFLDSDMLVFKPIAPLVARWCHQPYAAVGIYCNEGFSSFGLDRARMLRDIGAARFTCIDGAGHALFVKPGCREVFDMARDVAARYREIAGDIRFADEDALNIVLTRLGLPPMLESGVLARYLSAQPGTLEMDARHGHCRLVERLDGQVYEPVMMHFAANEAPWHYHRELWRLFRASGVPVDGLWASFRKDVVDFHVRPALRRLRRRLRG
ncbi:hypothetical protein [Ideonella livida]|uniref:Glycosyl transferase n=1 Tax=Ideonella livida TaxID=2707176 RepID=A0A7C9PI36_9BURK|nr:hypothetical protein [Ideonella livida]NDY92553.1 hypothetical protein [Ideonella livida]